MKKSLLTLTLLLLPLGATGQDNQTPAPKAKPCSTQQYRQFDFWIGEWEVKGPKGKVVGNSTITGILDGCAISEAWTGTSGYKGVSYNFYDSAKKLWHQTWIGGAGGALYLDGGLVDGKMVLEGKTPGKDGKTVRQKITWAPLPDGRVSQHWQISEDDGQSWQDSFLGYYSRK